MPPRSLPSAWPRLLISGLGLATQNRTPPLGTLAIVYVPSSAISPEYCILSLAKIETVPQETTLSLYVTFPVTVPRAGLQPAAARTSRKQGADAKMRQRARQ